MKDLFVLIAISTLLALEIEKNCVHYDSVKKGIKKKFGVRILYYILLSFIILFAGLRTTYNDTGAYIQGFTLINENDIRFAELFEPYGGFEIMQKCIKKYISSDPQFLILITSIFTNWLYIRFIAKYSSNFSQSILLFFLRDYMFNMAGIKQALAIAIGLLFIECILQSQYFKAILWLILAITIHPYIICIIVISLLCRHALDWELLVVMFVIGVAILNLEWFLKLISDFGKDYSMDSLTSSTINPMRVLIEALPVVLVFVCRRNINDSKAKMLILGSNMMVVAYVFILLGLVYNPIYFGRIGTYFASLSAVIVPVLLERCFGNTKRGRLISVAYYLIFTVYFLLDLTKLGTISLERDIFNHVSIKGLF